VPAAEAASYGLLSSWEGDTVTTRNFTWRDTEQKNAVVEVVTESAYKISGFENPMTFEAECKDISLDGSGQWLYEASVEGLTPETSYMYRVGGGEWSEPVKFTTGADADTSVTFAYMGDAQASGNTEDDYALWQKLTEKLTEVYPELAFAVMGGDNVNSGISLDEFDLFRKSASSVFSSVPFFSTVGNHESNFLSGKPELYLDEFAFPQNGPEGFKEEFYSFDYGNCHILVVNSWIFSGEQNLSDEDIAKVNNWIEADLASSTADWQVVVTHVPVYAVHSDTTSTKVQENWAGIFEKYGVDLVFEGHQHVYSRTYPLYQGQIDYENGITYIMGVSGSKSYDSSDETFAERVVYDIPNAQIVHTDGDSMTVQSIDANGNELDYVSIPKRSVDMTRSEYINALWRAAGSPSPSSASPFSDTSDSAVVWAYEKGYCLGYGRGRFGPDDKITEAQIKIISERMNGGK
jgi:hypothetical protein